MYNGNFFLEIHDIRKRYYIYFEKMSSVYKLIYETYWRKIKFRVHNFQNIL